MGGFSCLSLWFSLLVNSVGQFAASTHRPRRRFTLSSAVWAALFATGALAQQSYPFNRPIRLVVPTAPGDLSDIGARSVANEIGVQMGQQVVVENRPGAGGIIAYETIARATADGYTLAYVTNTLATHPSMHSNCTVLLTSGSAYVGITAARTLWKASGDGACQSEAYRRNRPRNVALHRAEPHAG